MRNYGVTRNLRELAEACNFEERKLARCYRVLVTELDLRVRAKDIEKIMIRAASAAGISERAVRVAVRVFREMREKGLLDGKAPAGYFQLPEGRGIVEGSAHLSSD